MRNAEKREEVLAEVAKASSSENSRFKGGKESEEQFGRPRNRFGRALPEYTPTFSSYYDLHPHLPPLSSEGDAYAFRSSGYRIRKGSAKAEHMGLRLARVRCERMEV